MKSFPGTLKHMSHGRAMKCFPGTLDHPKRKNYRVMLHGSWVNILPLESHEKFHGKLQPYYLITTTLVVHPQNVPPSPVDYGLP